MAMPSLAAPIISSLQTLLPSPMYASFRPASVPRRSRSVK
jgi:hypothetical protein